MSNCCLLVKLLRLLVTCLLLINAHAASAQTASKQTMSITLKQLLSSPSLLKTLEVINKKNQLMRRKAPSPVLNVEESGIPVGEDLILSLYIKESAFSELYVADLFALKSQRNAKLSLISLFEVLDFPINVDVNNKGVKGWFLKEDNKFNLQFPAQEGDSIQVIIKGIYSTLNKDNYIIMDDDLFVEADIVAKWFDLVFDFNYSDLMVSVTAKNPLPIQLSLARKNRKKANHYNTSAVFPWKETSYQFVSAPLLDIQLNASVNQQQTFGSYSLLSIQDMAYLTSELYINGAKNNALNNARLTFSKEDANNKLLGPLYASRYQFGDITPVKIAGGSTVNEQRGVRVTNTQSTLATDNNTTTLNGNIQAGWDAAVYRNGLFIDQQTNIQEGRYEFRDVQLFFGENNFEVILYGPQGQVRKVTSSLYVDSSMLKDKKSAYDVSFSQVNKSLLGVSDLYTDESHGWETAGVYSKGITDNFSLTAGGSYFFNQDGDNSYQYSLGSSLTPFKQLLLSAYFQQDNQNNQKSSISGRTRLANQSLSLSYTGSRRLDEYSDSISAQNYDFIMSGKLFSDSLLPLDYQNEWSHSLSDKEIASDVLSNQMALRTRAFSVSNQIYWSKNVTDYDHDEMLFGQLELQKNFSSLYTRLQAGYRLSPDADFSHIKGDFSYPLTNKLNSSLELNHTFDDDRYTAKLGLNWALDSMLLNSTASYDSDDNWSIGLFTSFGFGYEPVTDQFFMAKGSLAHSGSLVARVFEDTNLNGTFDDGERLLEGVKVKAVQSYRQETTNEKGIAVLKNLPNGRRTDIVIDPKTVDDPFVISATPGVSITSRKGFIEVLDIPMVNAGELEGTVYLKDRSGKQKSGAYLTINLMNSVGKIVATTETEFDGYYLFTELVPGKYSVTVAAADLKKKNLHGTNALTFKFGGEGDVIAGADFVIDKYTFVEGFVVVLGDFNSLPLMKAYWQISKLNYNNALQQQVFYSEDKNLQKFQLNAGFFKRKAQAERACNYLQVRGMNCSVKEFEFNL